MLAQSFKSAAELSITEPQRDALRKTLALLETGKLVHVRSYRTRDYNNKFTGHFNMRAWDHAADCGTIHCIGGTAEAITGDDRLFEGWAENPRSCLHDLFAPDQRLRPWSTITPPQAARGLRSYLTTGDAKWHEAIA
jgi:hypothetical protein